VIALSADPAPIFTACLAMKTVGTLFFFSTLDVGCSMLDVHSGPHVSCYQENITTGSKMSAANPGFSRCRIFQGILKGGN
jgi:hypothetical protein